VQATVIDGDRLTVAILAVPRNLTQERHHG
jgi:hypothetical protein